jgi:hypothetical protein
MIVMMTTTTTTMMMMIIIIIIIYNKHRLHIQRIQNNYTNRNSYYKKRITRLDKLVELDNSEKCK